MIRTVYTDVTQTPVFANPVNLVGVMGAGLAKQVAKRWPACLAPYRQACHDGTLKEGTVLAWHRPEGGVIFQAPTKHHWRQPSDLALVRQTIRALYAEATRLGLTELHLPALGCGLGGLSWKHQVEPSIVEFAERYPQVATIIHLQGQRP